jgi:hypothetical protein
MGSGYRLGRDGEGTRDYRHLTNTVPESELDPALRRRIAVEPLPAGRRHARDGLCHDHQCRVEHGNRLRYRGSLVRAGQG